MAAISNPSHAFGMHTETTVSISGTFVLFEIHFETPT